MAKSEPATIEDPALVAAVDLGSNSFHMVVGRHTDGVLTLIDRLREPVRLAAGLGPKRGLDEATIEGALGCLSRFGQRLASLPRDHVRAVGTSTLRRAKDSSGFLSRAREALGVPIEVLSGPEEARLVYLGVAHDLGRADDQRLVVDIGGGSTECVIGTGHEAQLIGCLQMGCVNYSRQYFAEGRLSRERFKEAELAARLEVKDIQKRFRRASWQDCVGSSGTIKAIGEILQANGWSEAGIHVAGLRELKRALIAAKHAERVELDGLSSDRRAVLPGGLAVLKAVFQGLKIEHMRVAGYALREGLLYDLVGRIEHHDVRETTVAAIEQRYHVDLDQAQRVQRTALDLFRSVRKKWELPKGAAQMLRWAARLHEVGLSVAYSGYHKHGAYLLAHADLPGFSCQDQALLGTLVRLHRRKPDAALIAELPPFQRNLAEQLVVLLRLAVKLNRGRNTQAPLAFDVQPTRRGLTIELPPRSFDEHPLTHADLTREADLLAGVAFQLTVREAGPSGSGKTESKSKGARR